MNNSETACRRSRQRMHDKWIALGIQSDLLYKLYTVNADTTLK